jgi:hypothetical protein
MSTQKEKKDNAHVDMSSAWANEQKTGLTGASVLLSSDFNIKGENVAEQIENARQRLRDKISKSRPKLKTAVSALTPYYADLLSNRFAVLNPNEFDSSYDTLVALVSGDKESSFCQSEVAVEEKDQIIINDLNVNVGLMLKEPYDIYATDSSLSAVYQDLDYLIANVFYEKKYGTPLLGYIQRDKKRPPLYHGPHFYKKRAISNLASMMSSTDKRALANSTLRLILELITRNVDPTTSRWEKWISQRKSRIPTYEQLVFAGISPDLKLKKYKSLFYQSEWDKLALTGIENLESEISEVQRKAVTYEDLDQLLRWSKETKEKLKDSLCRKALLVKKKRLTIASQLRGGKKMLDDIVKNGIQNEGEKTYFAPFFIVCENLNFSDAEMFSRIKSLEDNRHFFFKEFEEAQNIPRLISASGIEFAKAISY